MRISPRSHLRGRADRADLRCLQTQGIRGGAYADPDGNGVHSVLVWQRGSLLAEEYFEGRRYNGVPGDSSTGTTVWDGAPTAWGRDGLHDVHSVTKSVTSLLVGAAVHEGALSFLCLVTPLCSLYLYGGLYGGCVREQI